ncbi:hypothetical protein FACS189456_3630 [Bacteroidia bacterium]|nr:hypothetical protein FACS189456_3630 [Bacteroidia bacterium]
MIEPISLPKSQFRKGLSKKSLMSRQFEFGIIIVLYCEADKANLFSVTAENEIVFGIFK